MKIGPFEIKRIETGTSGGHGPWGKMTLKRDDYVPFDVFITPEEAEQIRGLEKNGPIFLEVAPMQGDNNEIQQALLRINDRI